MGKLLDYIKVPRCILRCQCNDMRDMDYIFLPVDYKCSSPSSLIEGIRLDAIEY